LQFFQKGMTAAFSIGFDGLMDGVVGSFKGFGILAEGLENLGKSIIKNNFNSWVNAFELDGKGGWDWNGERYQEDAWGSGALGMYASAFVTPMVQNKLDLKADGFLSDLKIDTDTLNRTAAGLIGETFDFAFSGEFNINVLNLSDLTGGNLHGGLLELSFGKDGFKGKVSSGGVNTSFGTMISSIKGLQGWDISSKLDKTNLTDKQKVAMRGLASNGMSRSQELFNQILNGETTITQAYRVAVGEIAKTTATADGKEIALNADDLNGYELGVILAHEAERNGLDDGLAGQKAETRRSVFAHSDHAAQVLKAYGNDALNGRMSQEAMIYAMMQNGDVSREDFEAYIDGTYDSSADFWKLTKDGKLVYDGDGWLKNEDGEYILSDGRFVKPEELTEEDKALRLGDKLIEKGLKKILGLDGQKVGDVDYGARVAQLLITDYAKMTLAEDGTWINEENEGKGFSLVDAVNAIMSHRDFGGRSMRGPLYDYPEDENEAMFNNFLSDEQKEQLLHDESYYDYTNFSVVPLAQISELMHQFRDEFTHGDVFSNLLTHIDNEIADNQRIIGYRREYYEAMEFIPSEVAMEEQNNQLERLLENSSLSERTKQAYRDALSYSFEESNLKGASAEHEFVRGLPREAGVATDVTWCVGGVENFYGARYPESDALYKLAQHPMPGWMNMQNTIDSGTAAGMPVFNDVRLALALVNAGGSVILIKDGSPAHGSVLTPQEYTGQGIGDLSVINVGQYNGLMDAETAFFPTNIPRVRFMLLLDDTRLNAWNRLFRQER
jgi:hypothetical protein